MTMRALVRFNASGLPYAVAVDRVREIRPAEGMRRLPEPRGGVAGVLPGEGRAVAILGTLLPTPAPAPGAGPGAGAEHIVVLESGERSFGLLVDRVTGVERFDERRFGPPPEGQSDQLLTAAIDEPGGLLLVVDPDVLARRLDDDAVA